VFVRVVDMYKCGITEWFLASHGLTLNHIAKVRDLIHADQRRTAAKRATR